MVINIMDGKEFKKAIRKKLIDKNYHSLTDFYRKELAAVISKPTFFRIINEPNTATVCNVLLIMDLLGFTKEEKAGLFE